MAFIRGVSYPLEVINGNLKLSEDAKLVSEHIYSVLETRPYERVMRADYGLMDETFENLNPIAINAKITAAVTEQVGEVEDLRIEGGWQKGDSGIYNVRLLYKVRGIQQPPLTLSLAI
jgi:hypothetical protein